MDPDTDTNDANATDDELTQADETATNGRSDDVSPESDDAEQPSTAGTASGDGDDTNLIPPVVPLADARGGWPSMSTDEEPATREVERDLTPDEVTIDRPDEFAFEYIPTDDLPRGVQYTPDFDPDWVYPSGSSDGGRQDDTPVQGLELGVVATEDTVEATVRSVLDAISLYYEDTGQYPRHRFIKSASAFEADATDGAGLVAVIQPSPDAHDGLMDHMRAVQANDDGAVNSNVETSRRLVQYVGTQLVADGVGVSSELDVVAATGWETGTRVGTLPIAERYGPLGAGELYDPTIEDLDLGEDGVASVTEAGFTPRRLSIDTNAELFTEPDG